MKFSYIKFLFFIFVLLFLQITCEAQDQSCEVILKIEKSLFNIDYSKQSEDARLKRIEENVYGHSSNKPIAVRIDKLSKDLFADLIGKEIKPQKDSFLEEDEIITKKEDKTMNYALVNNLEKKVFQSEFKTGDINNRLSALEEQVFKKNYSTDDLSTRISRLQEALMYNKFPVVENKTLQATNPKQKPSLAENNKDPDPNTQLISLEKSIFTKTFPDEKINDRLAKLESKVFRSTFANDDDQTRLNRIESAYQAKSSAKKYDSNRASQLTATAIEMGTLLLMILPFLLL